MCFSFLVASRAVDRVGWIASGLECPLWVSGPKCDPSDAESVCQYSSEYVESRCLPADLMVRDWTESDVILGVDWLSAHSTALDSRDKVVMFRD